MFKAPKWYQAYKVAMLLAWPLYVLRMILRSFKLKDYRLRMKERMGLGHVADEHKGGVLLHAVSFGEAKASTPIINLIKQEYPDVPITFTTSTPTGSGYAKTIKGVGHVYMPFDCSIFVNKFLKSMQPKVLVIMETELWPALIFEAAKLNIDIVIVNARLSDHSYKGYMKHKFFSSDMLTCVSKVLAQSGQDRSRYLDIGAKNSATKLSGNIKFDIKFSETVISKGAKLGNSFARENIITVASTHPQEEEQVLDAFNIIKKRFPDLLMILVPRHPERFNAVAELIETRGFKYVRRSEGVQIDSSTDILLGDTMGEMGIFFNASTLAFVGGSLVDIGGHNVLEPASVPVPVITGHYFSNFKEIVDKMVEAEAIVIVGNSSELADAVCELISFPQKSRNLALAAKKVVDDNQGATKITVDSISSFL